MQFAKKKFSGEQRHSANNSIFSKTDLNRRKWAVLAEDAEAWAPLERELLQSPNNSTLFWAGVLALAADSSARTSETTSNEALRRSCLAKTVKPVPSRLSSTE